ncbi:NAD(P)/FAD-dependent oxidoreductase [Acidianus hospitalis]|uniref:Dehydrogenase (Flavoprotein)-like protein n=1 Tax=Acidianus hospitalis (strain W1) TaxID=933801 RepID=F4B4C0_ACIHW|nr:NAD(P)/FAD-dependent oxidoreductase [Acidianus hospitalis]AEE94228.1 dehydrogenase (flavoprotein)-like protein [Acidianus hospitalis W1]
MEKIAVIGGGVSGSYLAYLLSNSGYDVTLFDIKEKYFKPCGDVVPNIYKPKFEWKIKYYIKNFAFYLDGERIYDVGYRNPKWIVIDKPGWINSMREKVNQVISTKADKSKFDLTIDAKGPYDMDRQVVYTTRALIETNEFSDEAILEFNTKFTGFFWIFPDEEGVLNVGAGFIENKNSKDLLLNYIKNKFKDYKILDLRGAPISIGSVKSKSLKIGEARGLVFPMSGEGIRPSAISAEIAYEAITRGKNFDEYLSYNLTKIERRIEIQRRLLDVYMKSNINARKFLLKTFLRNDILIDAFLEDKLDFEGILESARGIKYGSIVR